MTNQSAGEHIGSLEVSRISLLDVPTLLHLPLYLNVFQVQPLNTCALSLEQYGTSLPHSDTVQTIVENEDWKSETSAVSGVSKATALSRMSHYMSIQSEAKCYFWHISLIVDTKRV